MILIIIIAPPHFRIPSHDSAIIRYLFIAIRSMSHVSRAIPLFHESRACGPLSYRETRKMSRDILESRLDLPCSKFTARLFLNFRHLFITGPTFERHHSESQRITLKMCFCVLRTIKVPCRALRKEIRGDSITSMYMNPTLSQV